MASNGKLNKRIRSAWFKRDHRLWLKLRNKKNPNLPIRDGDSYKTPIFEPHFLYKNNKIKNRIYKYKWSNNYGGYVLDTNGRIEPNHSAWERYDEFSDIHYGGFKKDELAHLIARRTRPYPERGIIISTPGQGVLPAAMAAINIGHGVEIVDLEKERSNEMDKLKWEYEIKKTEKAPILIDDIEEWLKR